MSDPCCSCASMTEQFSVDLLRSVCDDCLDDFNAWADEHRGDLFANWPGLVAA